ncbi:aldehyde dehydrogenase family protein, partial [Kitasatospora putterlickiae]
MAPTTDSPEAPEFHLTDPRTGHTRGTLVPARGGQVAGAVGRARAAAPRWRALTPRERERRLDALADLIERHLTEYTVLEQAGTGKPEAEAASEIREVADLFRFYAGAARTGTAPAAGRYLTGHESWVRWEPVGVVAAVVPWNFPLQMAAWRGA